MSDSVERDRCCQEATPQQTIDQYSPRAPLAYYKTWYQDCPVISLGPTWSMCHLAVRLFSLLKHDHLTLTSHDSFKRA